MLERVSAVLSGFLTEASSARANWDTRSFRLNFELNVEIQDEGFAAKLAEITSGGRDLLLAEINRDRLLLRLRNNAARLLQPYL
jgi:cardiolipin synthase